MEIVLSLLLAAMLGALAGWVASILLHRESTLVLNIFLGILGAAAGALLMSRVSFGGPLLLMVVDIAAAGLLVWVVSLFTGKRK